MVQRGSSPRVWGKAPDSIIAQIAPRFIPTCVGKREAIIGGRGCPEVHPHVCGEKCRHWLGGATGVGSSPRVWGKASKSKESSRHAWFIPTCVGKSVLLVSRQVSRGFIPTCVGKSLTDFCRHSNATVHPHVCGEKLENLPNVKTVVRFIPTCVGKRAIKQNKRYQEVVHPHVCGEKVRKNGVITPLKWFIPTCVGKSKTAIEGGDGHVVHPHVCGEKRWLWEWGWKGGGSSPRVWGKAPDALFS